MPLVADKTPYYKRISYILVSVIALGFLIYIGQEILIPLIMATLLASLLLPANRFLERKRFPRWLAITLTLTIALISIGAILYLLTDQILSFMDDLPVIQDRLQGLARVAQKWIRSTFGITIGAQNQYLNKEMKESSGNVLQQTFGTLTGFLSFAALLPIYAALILFYRDLIKKFLIDSFGNSKDGAVREILQASQTVSQSFIVGLMIQMTVVFALNALGFVIIGIKYAIFLALISALLNLIPYIGMLVANVFCMLITLISGEALEVGNVMWVGIVLATVQFIDNNFLMTFIVGSKVRLNALVTVVGILIGGALCGVPGMFLSIPGLAVLKVICERVEGLEPYGMMLGDDRLAEPRKDGKDNTA